MSTAKGWIKLISFPYPHLLSTQIVSINDFEFVTWSTKKSNQILKYNIIENKWNEWIKIPDDIKCSYFIGAMMFDKNGSKLYFHSGIHQFIELDVHHKTHHIFDKVFRAAFDEGVAINGKCHIIGGLNNNKHLIWNNKQKKFDIQHEFEDFNDILCHRLIHLKSKKMLLFLGGTGANNNGEMNHIYSFNLDTSKWSKLPQILPNKMSNFGCIKSRNDQYILIFGGSTDNHEGKIDKIHVLNTKTMRFRESTIICPTKGSFLAINMNNSKKEQLLSCGYIRTLWNSAQFNNIMYPPFSLMQIIANYFSLEMIYLLDKQRGDLWKINIDEIITNCSK